MCYSGKKPVLGGTPTTQLRVAPPTLSKEEGVPLPGSTHKTIVSYGLPTTHG
jgi:hypothetical protein